MILTTSAGRQTTSGSRSRRTKPSRGDFGSEITMFDFSSGQSKLFQSFNDMVILRLLWGPDGRNIFVIFAAIGGQPFTVNTRLGVFSYPEAKFRILTNDVVDHDTISITADGKILATLQDQSATEVDVLDASGKGTPTAIPGIPTAASFGWDGLDSRRPSAYFRGHPSAAISRGWQRRDHAPQRFGSMGARGRIL